jgi:hypothetical protein
MIALVSFCTPAAPQERCPELTQLYAEAEEALKRAAALAAQDRCNAYIKFSVTWAEIARYARNHSELCDISIPSLSDIDKRHHQAVEERENVCGGPRGSPDRPPRRVYTFPPEIRPHW